MQLLQQWLISIFPHSPFHLTPLLGDASFRRYFRLHINKQTYIAVISPPTTENNAAFIQIANALAALELSIPTVLASELTHGFLLLRDLGDDTLFKILTAENADSWYTSALQALAKIQRCSLSVPLFDTTWMGQELQYFTEWVAEKHLHLTPSPTIQHLLQKTFQRLLHAATQQPQCFIHRDYHSRNLMALPKNQLGILDFQDAMIGPITYDLVSLIRDCYKVWPKEQVIQWAENFYHSDLAKIIGSKTQFFEWFDLMGMQRHLKASFIFARKYRRDHVKDYLPDLVRALQYVIEISSNYSEFNQFRDWLTHEIFARVNIKELYD